MIFALTELRRISKDAIPEALEKALRYRLLNEPHESESICLDILIADPENQQALVTLLLAITNQFETQYVAALERADEVLAQIADKYEHAYYEGILHERWAKAQLAREVPGHVAAGWLRKAMRSFERADELSTPDNPDASLRWNTCVRMLEHIDQHHAEPSGMRHNVEESFGDDVPVR